jgi:hypothetical protein
MSKKTKAPSDSHHYVCSACGQAFVPRDTSPSHLVRHPPKYCSRTCYATGVSKRVTLVCNQCGCQFKRKQYMKDWSSTRGPFCSFKCYGKWQSNNLIGKNRKRVTVHCHVCGTPIERQPSAVSEHVFCGRDCFGKWKASEECSGANSPSWLGGSAGYRGPNWNRQRRATRKRDDQTCQRCGAIGSHLPVHHIRPFRLFDDYRQANKLKNLRTLCPTCHGIEEHDFWATHPELNDKSPFPIVVPVAICRQCGTEFAPRSGATKVCDACCTIKCQHCGKSFYSRKAAIRKVKYCSRNCRNAHVSRAEPRILAADEIQSLLEACSESYSVQVVRNGYRAFDREISYTPPPWLYPIVLTALRTPLMQKNILELTWEQVDFHSGTIRIPDEKSKTRTEIVIPMSDELQKCLKGLTKGVKNAPVFGAKIGSIRRSFRSAVKRAGISGVTFHCLRKTGTDFLLRSGFGPEKED